MEDPTASAAQQPELAGHLPSSPVDRLFRRLDVRHGALLLCLALYLVQALPFLSYRWVTDESWYAGPAYSIAQGYGIKDPAIGPNDIENHLDVRPPGTALVMAFFFKLFGTSQITARLGSVFAGALLISLVYFLSRMYLGSTGTFAATLLIATDNLLLLTSRTARPEALTICMVFLSILCVAIYQQRGGLGWAALSGLMLAAGAMFHITLLGYILSAGILLIMIDHSRGFRWWRGVLTGLAAFLAGLCPFALWILLEPLGREGFRAEYLSRASQTSLLLRLLQEQRRYSDLIGLHMLHGHGLDSLPLRLPIPLLFLFASFLLRRYRRKWFYGELVLLLPSMLWLVYTVNKSSRYLVLLAPIFALAIGAAISVTAKQKTLRCFLFAAAALAGLAQFGANVFLLHSARKANYEEVARELREAIPADATAYGTITFWMALHRQPYISYERTKPQMAAAKYQARYFITGDRMMTDPENFGDKDFYTTLTGEMSQITEQSDLVKQIHDNYYGDLSIYRLRR